jgi:ketosteroid isomerase-like protein
MKCCKKEREMRRTHNYPILGFICVSILVLASCASGPTPAQSEEFAKAVEDIFAIWGKANLEEDVELYVSMWDEDCYKAAPGDPAITSLDALREAKAEGFKAVKYETFNIDFLEIQLAGDFGWVLGRGHGILRPAGGEPFEAEGRFITIFKKQADGSWKVYRDFMF